MILIARFQTLLLAALLSTDIITAQTAVPNFKVIALAEAGGIHRPFVDAARVWLQHEAEAEHFSIDYIQDTAQINDEFLSHYQLFIQLNYPPYGWTPTAAASFEKYIEQGRGGWIGFHHATLLGEFDGYPIWPWFQSFMGGIRYKNYISTFVTATVKVEAPNHPVMRNVSPSFQVKDEEWYTYDKSPRPNVDVLASVDEATYSPSSDLKMGDHPVVWSNPHYKARNVYIFMGHRPEHFQNPDFTAMFHNAIKWAAHTAQPRVLALYSIKTELDHVQFANQAIQFFTNAAQKDHFDFETTTNWDVSLAGYQLVLWLNDSPHTQAQRDAFQNYMDHGGAWLGFHAAGYNDKDTNWRWFVDFLGGAVFYSNNWPPLPAMLNVDDPSDPVTAHLPKSFTSPTNEWYIWKPSPRASKDVKVLVTFDPSNYPIGFKDTLTSGDLPVVWTNTRYRMLYMNMGHGDKVFSSDTQNKMFEDAVLALLPRLTKQ